MKDITPKVTGIGGIFCLSRKIRFNAKPGTVKI